MKKFRVIISGVFVGIILIVVMALSLFACSPARNSQASTASEESALMSRMIDNKLYKVDFVRAYPVSAPSFPLTGEYYVSIVGERVESFLPYFGRAFSVAYGGGSGLHFDAVIANYRVTTDRKGKRQIYFEASNEGETFMFLLSINPSGGAYLNDSSPERQSIAFSGAIDLDAEFEAVRLNTP